MAQRGTGGRDPALVPLSRDQYRAFVDALLAAETVPLHAFEAALYFEGCLPIEELAHRGPKTLAFGPMKPVGLVDPCTGKRPYAVVQLRQEDKAGVLYNFVGFQTKLRIGEQKSVLRSLPGLGEAVFARFGSVHRNTYINAPKRLLPSLMLKARPGLYIAGQMAGVEGYVESAALGGMAGVNAARAARGLAYQPAPPDTAHGALVAHLMNASAKSFQPMNVNYGLFPALDPQAVQAGEESSARQPAGGRLQKEPSAQRSAGGRSQNKRQRNERIARRALASFSDYLGRVPPEPA